MSNLHPRTARTRAAILDAAWKLIADRGLDVGMAEIADSVGVTRQTIHIHFGTRGGLLIALVRRADEREDIHASLLGALERADPRERLDAFLREWLDFVPKIYPVARQLIAAEPGDAEAAAAWRDRMEELRNGFLLLTRGLRNEKALAAQWTAPQAADYLWASASVQAWELLAIARGWGHTKTEQTLRRSLARVVLA